MSLLNVYPVFDIEPVKGQGSYIYDVNGNKYLDFYGGHAVISIGHSHPHFVNALNHQAEKLVFYSNSIVNNLQKKVSEKVDEIANLNGKYDLFMINSGAEAIENAIKIASFSNGRKKYIVLENSFHGRTAGAISITDGMKHKTSFNTDFTVVKIPINDVEKLSQEMGSDVCAIIVESIQGIGGIHICSDTFLKEIESQCKEYGALFIADEIQCGFGRSGRFFAFQYAGVTPDIITMAKGMGNGFPVGGVLVKKETLTVEFGMAGSTFGGNHLACAAVLAVLEVIEEEELMKNSEMMGKYLMEELNKLDHINEVRGNGLMIGIEMDFPVKDFRSRLVYDKKVFTGSSSQTNVIRLLPPLNTTKEECDLFLEIFEKSIEEVPLNINTV